MMTPEQEGAYIRLLCHEWEDPTCSLPDDDSQLAVLSRLGERWLNDRSTGVPSCSTIVRSCFVPHPKIKGRIINKRLYREYVKQQKFREQRSKAGISSGKARGKNKRSTSVQRKRNDRSTTVKHPLNGEGTLQPSGVSPDNPQAIEKTFAEKPAFRTVNVAALIQALIREKVPGNRWKDFLLVVEKSLSTRRPPPPGVKDSPTGYAIKVIETKATEIHEAAAADEAAKSLETTARFDGSMFTEAEKTELIEKHKKKFPGIEVVFYNETQPFEPDPEPPAQGNGKAAPYYLLQEFPTLWALNNRSKILAALVKFHPDDRLPALQFAMEKIEHTSTEDRAAVVYQAITEEFRVRQQAADEDPVHASDSAPDEE